MIKNYPGLLSRLCNTPLLMSEDKLRIITEAVTLPLLLGQADTIERVPTGTNATVKEFADTFKQDGRSIAIISIFDSLVSKDASAGSGMMSYQRISYKIDNAIANGATDIGFYIDSPGGETSVFGLAEKIRSLPSRGIKTFCFCDMAASAGYAIASATQHIYATQVAPMGSIAAILVHSEISEKEDGVTYTVMRSKEQKALADPYTKLSTESIEKLTSMLAILDTEFNNDIIKGRPLLTLESIIALKGDTFIGSAALAVNLVDAIVPNLENALSLFLKDTKLLTSQKPSGVRMSDETLQTQLADATVKLTEASTNITALETSLSEAKTALTTAVAAETARVVAVLESAVALKMDLATAIKYADSKYSAEIALECMTDLAEARDQGAGLDNSTGAPSAGNPDNSGQSTGLRASYKQATNI